MRFVDIHDILWILLFFAQSLDECDVVISYMDINLLDLSSRF